VLDTTGYFASGTDPAPETYVLTVLHSGTGTGTVTSADGRMNCGAVCTVSYVSGTSVNLTASPTGGSSFAGWSGGGCSGTGNCTVTVSGSITVAATFNPVRAPTYFLTGNWAGTVLVTENGLQSTVNASASIAQTDTGFTATLTVLAPGDVPVIYTVNGQISGTAVNLLMLGNPELTAIATATIGPNGLTVSGSGAESVPYDPGTGTGTLSWNGQQLLSASGSAADSGEITPWTGSISSDGQHLSGSATATGPDGVTLSWNLTRQ